jgi:hypothetical protein
MKLFPTEEEQKGIIAVAETSMNNTMPATFSLQEKHIDEILRSGGGKRNSRKRIYAKYTEGKTHEEMTEFLKNEYGRTGKGFKMDGHPISVWFDEDGMSVGYGMSGKDNIISTKNWGKVEENVHKMVENGSYMCANEAYLVENTEYSRVAGLIYYFFRDGMDELPESL